MTTKTLSDTHRAMLADSGLTPEVIDARGYWTATAPKDLRGIEIGGEAVFSRRQTGSELLPSLVVPMWSVDGDVALYQHRPDTPRTDSRSGKTIKYETPSGARMILDVPPTVREHIGNPAVDLWVTEGAKKADSAAVLGVPCIALAGVWNFRGTNVDGGKTELPDWDRIALNGRSVYVAFDSDVVTKDAVKGALRRLSGLLKRRGADVRIAVLESQPDGSKTGLDDLLAVGKEGALEELKVKAVPADDYLADAEAPLTELLAEYIQDTYELVRDRSGQVYGIVRAGGSVARPLDSGRFSIMSEAPARMREAKRTPIMHSRDIGAVRDYLDGLKKDYRVYEPGLRAVQTAAGIVIDLGRDDGKVVEVTAEGWKVREPSADLPLFTRSDAPGELPIPTEGGSISDLRKLINVDDTGFDLVHGWLLGAFFADHSRPWLYFQGTQGSGKSQAARAALSLVDPQNAAAADMEKGGRFDLVTTATNNYMVALDNLTGIKGHVSDTLASLTTGARMTRRVLHTTNSEMVVELKRAGVFTGIDIIGIRNDLRQRMVAVPMQPFLGSEGRVTDDELRRMERELRPGILGALLSEVSAVLRARECPEVVNREVQRLGDYSRNLRAYDHVFATDLYGAYAENIRESFAEALAGDMFARTLRELLLDKTAEQDVWTVAPGALLEALEERKPRAALGTDINDYDWPGSAKYLTKHVGMAMGLLDGEFTFRKSDKRTKADRGGYVFQKRTEACTEACTSMTRENAEGAPIGDASDANSCSPGAKTYMCTCTDLPRGDQTSRHSRHPVSAAAPETVADQVEQEMHASVHTSPAASAVAEWVREHGPATLVQIIAAGFELGDLTAASEAGLIASHGEWTPEGTPFVAV
ncbi:hypothetical protein GCM10023224_40740 [Streptomonospora halophila]|uniref:DUF3854 domain-containing protein n=1 Tax=Streptomonospora halophila TaxID=427369 RepID=A0ABP9GSK9_9ACTN